MDDPFIGRVEQGGYVGVPAEDPLGILNYALDPFNSGNGQSSASGNPECVDSINWADFINPESLSEAQHHDEWTDQQPPPSAHNLVPANMESPLEDAGPSNLEQSAITTSTKVKPRRNRQTHPSVHSSLWRQIKANESSIVIFQGFLANQYWYNGDSQNPEPRVDPEEAFVANGFAESGDETRFRWWIHEDTVTRRFLCRIPHWSSKGRQCQHNVLKPKDALAHVCEYFRYEPFVCEGNDEHVHCGKRFLTRERLCDHYSKERKKKVSPEKMVKCPVPGCKAKQMFARNLPRHQKLKHDIS